MCLVHLWVPILLSSRKQSSILQCCAVHILCCRLEPYTQLKCWLTGISCWCKYIQRATCIILMCGTADLATVNAHWCVKYPKQCVLVAKQISAAAVSLCKVSYLYKQCFLFVLEHRCCDKIHSAKLAALPFCKLYSTNLQSFSSGAAGAAVSWMYDGCVRAVS